MLVIQNKNNDVITSCVVLSSLKHGGTATVWIKLNILLVIVNSAKKEKSVSGFLSLSICSIEEFKLNGDLT